MRRILLALLMAVLAHTSFLCGPSLADPTPLNITTHPTMKVVGKFRVTPPPRIGTVYTLRIGPFNRDVTIAEVDAEGYAVFQVPEDKEFKDALLETKARETSLTLKSTPPEVAQLAYDGEESGDELRLRPSAASRRFKAGEILIVRRGSTEIGKLVVSQVTSDGTVIVRPRGPKVSLTADDTFGIWTNPHPITPGTSDTAYPYSYPSSTSNSPGGDVYVRGYTRKDGTYVQPHTRSRPSK